MDISVIIPAYNEEGRIGTVIEEAMLQADEIIVIDDGSTDGTRKVSEEAEAKVLQNRFQAGYVGALNTGFNEAEREVIVTMDGDGEHDPADIPKLLKPIEDGSADVVLGKREEVDRPSEKFLCSLARLRVKVDDCGTGFRALRKKVAKEMSLPGHCTCGTFVLEAKTLGARITEAPINLKSVDKPRGIAWKHIPQIAYVLKFLLLKMFS